MSFLHFAVIALALLWIASVAAIWLQSIVPLAAGFLIAAALLIGGWRRRRR